MAFNGVELFPSVNPSKSASSFQLEACQSGFEECTTLLYGENVEYGYETYYVATTPFSNSGFKALRFTANGRNVFNS